jgi:hypothetical protein
MAKQLPLDDERVKAFRSEIDSYIDGLVEQQRKLYPGIPAASHRAMLTRGIACQCAAFLEINAKAKVA